jgi:hypothetical protein
VIFAHCPTQITAGIAVAVAMLIVTVAEAEAVHPFTPVTVTVYVEVTAGHTLIDAAEPPGGLLQL